MIGRIGANEAAIRRGLTYPGKPSCKPQYTAV